MHGARRERRPRANPSITRSSTTRRRRWCTPRRRQRRCSPTARAFTWPASRAVARDRAERFPAAAGFRSRPRHDARQRRGADARQRAAGCRRHARRVSQADRARQLRLADLRRRRRADAGGSQGGSREDRRRRGGAGSASHDGERKRCWSAGKSTSASPPKPARAAVRGATPTEKNSYKVPMLEAVVRRTTVSRDGLAAAPAGTAAP